MARASHARGDAPLDSEQAAFRRNLFVVGAVHGVLLVVFFVAGKFQAKPAPTQLVWLDGSAFGAAAGGAAAKVASETELEPAEDVEVVPEKTPEPVHPPEAPREAPPSPSEIVIPPITPAPTPVHVTPKPATPKPATPKPATPKPATPRATPTTPKAAATTKPKPKASPKPTPTIAKATATPDANAKKSAESDDAAVPKATPAPRAGNDADAGKAGSTGSNSSGAGPAAGKGGSKSGSGTGAGNNEFAWYYEMLDDRFTSRWEQPLTIVRSSQQFVTTLKIRIDKDGKIVSREIANPSGNPLMDDSVMAAAQKVLAVDPLPAGLGGSTFDVNINFTLDQGL